MHALCIAGKPFNKIRFYGGNFIIFESNVWDIEIWNSCCHSKSVKFQIEYQS